ncbi:MAG: Uncharacterized protein G01um101425_666 [Candidatus Peregrinibacteria bacterium Gr01-1014_25]|nr:MAG: Uncharacterized protein G01um101425_666 [Candidatus Peregrinibacteria bacterium Gr01-1014_25]
MTDVGALNVSLTWDLLIMVFVAIITAYSFIVGRRESLKIILATYVAAVAVQGISAFLAWLLSGSTHMLTLLGIPPTLPVFAVVKLLLFVACIIAIVVRGGLSIDDEGVEGLVATALTAASGLVTAGLLLVTLLTYIAGAPLLDPHLAQSPALQQLLEQSSLASVIVQQQALLYTLPAILLITSGFLRKE